jgi:hypothetical protein
MGIMDNIYFFNVLAYRNIIIFSCTMFIVFNKKFYFLEMRSRPNLRALDSSTQVRPNHKLEGLATWLYSENFSFNSLGN